MTFLCFGTALNSWFRSLGLLLLIVVCALLPGTARGQASAAIKGTVYDTSGGIVPDATVVLHNTATNLDRTTSSNGAGAYVIPDIQPGDYDLKISKEGFKTVVQAGIPLAVNQTATLDVTLSAGSITDSITVAAEALTVEASTAELGVAVVKQQVNDLPLNGRNFTQLLNLTPGVSTINVAQNSTTSGGIWSNPVGTFSYPSINGQTNRSNLYLLDGLNNQGSFGSTYAVAPIVDAIQEFKVQSHNDDTSYGGALGGIVNVVSKSGTAQYHATLWEFVRNTRFDARNPFLAAVTPFQQNQFGVAGGGPLYIPWHHSGVPKTFFFAAYEGFRLHTAASNLYNVPTSAELGGDLTTVGGLPFGGQIYNPYSVVPNASSPTGFSNSPFLCVGGNPSPDVHGTQSAGTACNKIPTDLLDPNMIGYATKLFPTPNRTPSAGSPFNAVDITKSIVRQDEFSARLDHQITDNDNIFGRWSQFRQPVAGSGGFAGLSHFQITNGYNVGVEYMHTFSSSAVLEAHFGRVLLNISQGSGYSRAAGATGTDLGFSPNFASGFIGGVDLIPNITINGFIGNIDPSAHGASHTDQTQGTNIWEFGGNFTKTHGHHTFKMGADFASNNAKALYLNASEVFSSANTDNVAATGTAGSSLASFLLGVPNSFKRRNVKETEHGGWVDGAYFLDSWRVTNKLTINFGVRYDVTLMPIYGSIKDGNGYTGDLNFNNGTYVLTALPPQCDPVNPVPPCIPFGIGPGGTNPQPGQSYLPANVVVTPHANGAIFQNDLTNFQPRFGFAYQLTHKTVLRASYGRFYDNWAAVTQSAQNYEGSWPDTGQLGAALNPVNAPPTPGLAEAPAGTGPAVAGPSPFTGFNWYADPHMQRPYADQFNFGVQQQLDSRTVLTVNYVGSRGHRLDVGFSGNTGKIPSAVANYLPTGATTSSPYPYISPADFDAAIGKSSYNALQASLNGRAFHGLTYLVSYTWSKTLDLGCTGWYGVEGCSIQNPYTLKNDKGPAGTDVPQIFSAAWVYEVPLGKGHKYSSSNEALNYVVGGWTLNGILSFSSGIPFFVGASGDIAHIAANTACCALGFGNYERLNYSGGNPYAPNRSPTQWLNTSVFSVPAAGTFGTLGRNTLRSDRFKNLDLSLFKQFPITESKRLEFRFETFNLTNTPVWGVPDVNISDGAKFGTISSTANTARQLQFGLKLYF